MQKFKALIIVIMAAKSFPLWADQKIAVININAALVGSSLAQNEITALQESAEFVGLRAKLESAASDFQTLGKELEEKRLTWSSEQVAEHQKRWLICKRMRNRLKRNWKRKINSCNKEYSKKLILRFKQH